MIRHFAADRSLQEPSAGPNSKLPASLLRTCRRLSVTPSRFLLLANVTRQVMWLFERAGASSAGAPPESRLNLQNSYRFRRSYRISTSRFGVGQIEGSNQTPLGLHRVAEKIGGGQPIGTVFRGRQAVGVTWQGLAEAAIVHRILWLEGLEPGFNRAGSVDSHARYIYIHGTGDEPSLGRPASHGCIHLSAADLLPLFDLVPRGTLVWIGL